MKIKTISELSFIEQALDNLAEAKKNQKRAEKALEKAASEWRPLPQATFTIKAKEPTNKKDISEKKPIPDTKPNVMMKIPVPTIFNKKLEARNVQAISPPRTVIIARRDFESATKAVKEALLKIDV